MTRTSRIWLFSALCLFGSVLLSTSASATETYSADYYDDGEYLYLIEGWEDPYAVPDPEADFYAPVNMPLHNSGGGGCCGSGQTNGMEPVTDADHVSEVAQLADASAVEIDKAPEPMSTTSSVPCPRRRCPPVMSTGRRTLASGLIRVVFQQDNGDGFSMFARLAREEPRLEISHDLSPSGLTCTSETEVRKNALAAAILTLHHPRGTYVTAEFPDGSDTWEVQCVRCTPASILEGEAAPKSTTGRCRCSSALESNGAESDVARLLKANNPRYLR